MVPVKITAIWEASFQLWMGESQQMVKLKDAGFEDCKVFT